MVKLKIKRQKDNQLSEETEQMRVATYLNGLVASKKIVTFFAPMNENKQSFTSRSGALKIEAKAKKMGKQKGVSDLVIIGYDSILFVELKRAPKILESGKLSISNSRVSEHQKMFLESVNKSNVVDGVVCYGFDHAKDVIDRWLNKELTPEDFEIRSTKKIKTKKTKRMAPPKDAPF